MRLRFVLSALLVVSTAGAQDFSMTQLGDDHSLDSPWEIAYGPDDMLWVTERNSGRIVRVDPDTGEQDELIVIEEVDAPREQSGLLGMTLHPNLGRGTGSEFVYAAYTYSDGGLRTKLVRYTYTVTGDDGVLSDPVELVTGLPGGTDHQSGRLVYGPDDKLYYSIGDQGANQFGNKCTAIRAQSIPSRQQVDAGDWSSYEGKVLRLEVDGAIPADNPVIHGVRSHIYTYGHRNAQGLVFSSNGTLYSSEHGPKTDDELNIIEPGRNYGWPNVAGFRDDMAYEYCDWSSAASCEDLKYDAYSCPAGATSAPESGWSDPGFMPPLKALFTVDSGFNFKDTTCSTAYVCWPTVAPSSIDIYEAGPVAEWRGSLLLVSLKRGAVLQLKLSEGGNAIVGDPVEHLRTQNRYRDMAISPDGATFYIATDNRGQTSGPTRGSTNELLNPGTILKFRYLPPGM